MHKHETITVLKALMKWEDKLIWTKNQLKHDVICIPRDTFQRGRRLIKIIIDHPHQVIGHYGQWKMSNYIQQSYWWPHMATDIEAFCRSCRRCQTNKTNTQKSQGILHSLPVPDKLWQLVGMDFMGPLPQLQGNDYLLVIIDQLTLQVHLVPTMTQVTAREVAWLFLKETMRLHCKISYILLWYICYTYICFIFYIFLYILLKYTS